MIAMFSLLVRVRRPTIIEVCIGCELGVAECKPTWAFRTGFAL
jgi:hypothetical protein